jgi:AraC-like DNA-binding protein
MPAANVEERGEGEQHHLRVLGVLLGTSAEARLLRQAVRPPMVLGSVEDRLRVLPALRELTPDVIVFGMQDRYRLPTAPLVSQCARERPGCRIVVLCAAPPRRSGAILAASRVCGAAARRARPHAILAASRAGARVLVAPTPHELSSLFQRLARALVSEPVLDFEALTPVQPPMLRRLLCAAAMTVAGDGGVGTLARNLRVSTRTLSRHTRQTSLLPPKALLTAVRVLWACALMESAGRDLRSVARATGFAGPDAMRLAIRRYLAPVAVDEPTTPLPSYRDALHQVVGALGGHLTA